MKFKTTTCFTCYFHFDTLTFNPILKKKNMQLSANMSSKWLNCAKIKLKDQIEKFNYYNPRWFVRVWTMMATTVFSPHELVSINKEKTKTNRCLEQCQNIVALDSSALRIAIVKLLFYFFHQKHLKSFHTFLHNKMTILPSRTKILNCHLGVV
jgi:hypothetical protein